MNILYLIPARGGSKGLPGKNIKKLNGKPLILYAIDTARKLSEDSNICVTSDDEEIIATVESYGLKVPFIRPDHLSTDTSGSSEVIIHTLEFYKNNGKSYDCIVLLQPTSPLRTWLHVKEAIDLYTNQVDMIASVKESSLNPYYNLFEESKEGYLKKSKEGHFIRRQDCPKVWEYNGAIYVINVKSLYKYKRINLFSKVIKYQMDDYSSVDIDNYIDFKIAELLMNEKDENIKNHPSSRY